jgi:hypothetical protein
MRTCKLLALVTASILVSSTDGRAWGRDGHQVIANLTQSRLSPAVKQGIAALFHGAALASVSSEADNVRNSHPETARWHYVTFR